MSYVTAHRGTGIKFLQLNICCYESDKMMYEGIISHPHMVLAIKQNLIVYVQVRMRFQVVYATEC